MEAVQDPDRNFFDEALLRLKAELRVLSDKDVAKHLGMKPTAFNVRKSRASFPREKVVAMGAEGKIDAAFVLTGVRSDVHAQLAKVRVASEMAARLPGSPEEKSAMAGLLFSSMAPAPDEQMLLDAYRAMDAAGKKALLSAALGVLPPASVAQNNQGDNAIQVAHAAGKVSIKRR